MKPTKRKAFNFLRSYFDVLNEIPKKEDKLSFLIAIINKQFLDEDPKDLNLIAKLSYESQRHHIEESVKGYKSKTSDPMQGGCEGGRQGATQGATQAPSVQEEEEEKEEEKEKNKRATIKKFLSWFNARKLKYLSVEGRFKSLTSTDFNNLVKLKKEYSQEDFEIAFNAMSKSKWALENSMVTPAHFLRNDNFNKYLNSKEADGGSIKPKPKAIPHWNDDPEGFAKAMGIENK